MTSVNVVNDAAVLQYEMYCSVLVLMEAPSSSTAHLGDCSSVVANGTTGEHNTQGTTHGQCWDGGGPMAISVDQVEAVDGQEERAGDF